MAVTVTSTPPPEWDAIACSPMERTGFAIAMQTMGYEALYCRDAHRTAIALVRGRLPGGAAFTARANLFPGDADPTFVAAAVRALGALGIPFVKVGDTMHGVPWSRVPGTWPFPLTRLVERHTFTLDLTRSDEALLGAMDGAERKIRKAAREGVEVRRVATAAELAAFCALCVETSDRVRGSAAYTAFPRAFFEVLYEHLAPTAAAHFYVAWHDDQPLAACVFLCSGDTMLYYLGGSTRDRAQTARQAPSAVFWQAMRDARALGLSRFDFGGCTPTAPPDDSRHGVYLFKKRWGGRLETFSNLEVVLSPLAYRVQERVLVPLWNAVQPMYFTMLARLRASG